MNENIIYIPDDQFDIIEKSKMYYHLCCGDILWIDFDESWINTWKKYQNSWYICSIVMDNNKYVWFRLWTKAVDRNDYITRNIWYNRLYESLNLVDAKMLLNKIHYIEWIYVYPEYRKTNIWSNLLKFHEQRVKEMWYDYVMTEYNSIKLWLWKRFENNWYIKLFDYIWTHPNDTSKTKKKILMIKSVL